MAEVSAEVPLVKLCVGGQRFETTSSTLLSVPDTYLVLLSGRLPARMDGDAYFIDRDPAVFPLVLSYLRDGTLPTVETERVSLYYEAEFFAISPLVTPLEALLDGRARLATLSRAALLDTSYDTESACRAFFGGEAAALPDGADSLLLRPFKSSAVMETFRRTSELPPDSPIILSRHRLPPADGERSIVHSQRAFNGQLKFFTRGSLLHFPNWDGILIAGGAVLGPLLPLPPDLAAKAYGNEATRLFPDYIRQGQARYDVIHFYNAARGLIEFLDSLDRHNERSAHRLAPSTSLPLGDNGLAPLLRDPPRRPPGCAGPFCAELPGWLHWSSEHFVSADRRCACRLCLPGWVGPGRAVGRTRRVGHWHHAPTGRCRAFYVRASGHCTR